VLKNKKIATCKGNTHKIKVPKGTLFVTINKNKDKYSQIFINVSQTGSYLVPICEALGRIISLSLRKGATLKDVIKQLEGIKDTEPIWYEGNQILSIPDGIAHVLKEELNL